MSDLRSFQLTLAKVLTGLGIVHVPVLAAICAVLGRERRGQCDCLRGSRAHPHCADLRRTVDHHDCLWHCHYAGRPDLAVGAGIQRAPLAGRNALLLLRGSRDAVGILRLARAGAGSRPGEPASPEPQLHFAGCHLSRRRQPMAGERSCRRRRDRGGDVDIHRPYDPGGFRNGGAGTATRRRGGRRTRNVSAASATTTSWRPADAPT